MLSPSHSLYCPGDVVPSEGSEASLVQRVSPVKHISTMSVFLIIQLLKKKKSGKTDKDIL